VEKLEGISDTDPAQYPYNLVYHLPAYVAIRPAENAKDGQDTMFGGQVEGVYSSTAFAKMYTAINFWKIGPCVTGKSTMFRRSDLDARECKLHTTVSGHQDSRPRCNHTGLDTLSDVLCEDQMIADFLWNKKTPSPRQRHGLLLGELAIQPVRLDLREYCIRHMRWIRARKWNFLVGTLLEPTTECCFCFIAVSLSLSCLFHETSNEATITYKWWYSAAFMGTSLVMWATTDYLLYQVISNAHQRGRALTEGERTSFSELKEGYDRPSLHGWMLAWATREILAVPIWVLAIFGGNTVTWRGRNYSLTLNGKLRYHGI
jgi:ceramide glucosyltransferase